MTAPTASPTSARTAATTTTTAAGTTTITAALPATSVHRTLTGAWPLAAAGAGLAAFAFTALTSRFITDADAEGGVAGVYAAVQGDGLRTQLGVVAAFVCVVLLAVFTAGFGRFLAARAPEGSLPAAVARLGLGASVATVALAASLKAIYRGGLPDHGDSGMYVEESVVTLQVLVDQYQWAAYWTIALAMGAVAVLGLVDRVLPRWYAGLSALLTVFVVGMTLVLGLPYSAGIAAPVWLVATTVALLRLRRRLA